MSMWLMYLILKLDDIINVVIPISGILGFFIAGGGFGLLGCYIYNSTSFYTEKAQKDADIFLKNTFPKLLKIFKKCLYVEIILVLMLILTPSTKQAAAIYFVPKVINNKQIQKMPNKLVVLANSWMDEQIKSIKKIDK